MIATTAVGANPHAVAYDGFNIYVTNFALATVSIIDPDAGVVTATVPVGDSPIGIVYDGANIYVANLVSNNLTRLRPR